MTRIGLSLVIAALLLHAPATHAAQLDKDSCAKLKTEQGQLEQGGTRGSMVRGPEWAKSNLAPDRLEVIRRLIEVDEQLLFRCGGRPLVLLPNGDPDPAAREVESPKGPPAKAAKPPQAVKKAPDAEKKKVVPPNKASALPADPGYRAAPPANAVPSPAAAPAAIPVKESAPVVPAPPPVTGAVTPASNTMPQPAVAPAASSPPPLSKEEEDKKAAAIKAAKAKAAKKKADDAKGANSDWFFNPFSSPAPPAKK